MTQALHVIPSFDGGQGIVELLEETLAQAREGQLSMIAIAKVDRDGSWGRCWSKAHNTATMVGAIEMMKRDIVEKHCEQ